MSILIPPTPASNKSTEQHQEPSEQDSFNHLLYKVLRLTSQQVQDLNGWMEHRGIPNVHEVIAQNYRKPHTLEDNLKFITQGKTCYIQSNVMLSLSLMITYIRYRRYSTKSKYFGPFYYIQIDPQDYDEWRFTPPEEEIHFSGPNDEDEHQNLSSDDNQVIQQENFCSEPPEPLSYSLFQSHFQGSSTSNTQKIFLPKPTWENPPKINNKCLLIISPTVEALIYQHPTRVLLLFLISLHHNRQPNLSKCTPINLMRAQLTQSKLRPPLLTLYWQWLINPSTPLMMLLQTSAMSFQLRGLLRFHSVNATLFQHANHTNQQLVDHGANGGLAGSDMRGIHRTYCKIKIQDIDNHEVAGLDVVTAATPLKEKSLAYSMNMSTFGRDHPFIHQVNLNGFRPMLMKHLSKLVVPNLSILWMDILSLFSSRMVWPMPPHLEDPQIRTWTHIHMSSSHLLINGTTVKSLTNPLVTPCLMLMVISISPSLPTSTPSWMHLQEIVGHTQKSLLFSQPISIRVHPKSLTGLLNAHLLHGHPHPASRTLSMSPPDMELLHTPRITLKSTLSLAILFSASPDAVRLLQQTPSSLTPLLLMMVQPWPNSSVAVIPLSVMHMA